MTATAPDTDGVWSAGETVTLRIDESEVSLALGAAITVRVVHAPSGSTVLTRRFAG